MCVVLKVRYESKHSESTATSGWGRLSIAAWLEVKPHRKVKAL
jgi:hypothetical protein